MPDMTGVLLAGGQSSRMGSNKALLELGGERVIESILREMSPVTPRIIIAANDRQSYQFLGQEIVLDRYPGQGPLSGLHAALTSAGTPWCIVSACDLPFVTTEVFRFLKQAAEEAESNQLEESPDQAIIPVVGGRIQPLLAAYHNSALPALEHSLSAGRLRMTDWLGELRVRYILEEELLQHCGGDAQYAFFNMNHPEEYAQAQMKLKNS